MSSVSAMSPGAPARLCHTVSIHRLVSLSRVAASVIVCGRVCIVCGVLVGLVVNCGDGDDGHWLSFRGEG
jgi:hypothetical protein